MWALVSMEWILPYSSLNQYINLDHKINTPVQPHDTNHPNICCSHRNDVCLALAQTATC